MDHEHHQNHQKTTRDFLKRFWVVTFLLIPLFLLSDQALSFFKINDFPGRKYLQLGVATAIFYFSLIFFQHAKHEIKMKQYGMMTLVSLAVGAGYLFSAASTFIPALAGTQFYPEIATLIWILLFGHYLEAKSSVAAGDALSEVAKLLPKKVIRLENGKKIEVEIDELKKGDRVQIKPGGKIPADGVIVKGKANVDESLISGESKPVSKKSGDDVVAGSICLNGSLEIRLEKIGENSTVGQIQKLISGAQKTKPQAQKLADKAAGILTMAALATALLTVLVWSLVIGKSLVFALTLAITVLVIACPHALGLAIPTVTTIATTLAAKNGLFLKDLSKLEIIKNIDWVVFDKTGTLTEGKFGVTNIINLNLKNENEILKIAASLEEPSSHVIAKAIVKQAQEKKIRTKEVTAYQNLAGKGGSGQINKQTYYLGNRKLMKEKKINLANISKQTEGLTRQGKTVVFLADENQVLGLLALADSVKKEAKKAVRELHRQKIKVAMLTGDNQETANHVARQLDIDDYFAEVLPKDKYQHIKSLQEKGDKVMMVGDGINDAPALTQADVGVAIGAGTDVAVEAGDIVLTRNNPLDISRLSTLSRKVYRKMQENLFWATGYNVVAIPAAAGVLAPWGFFLRPQIGALLMGLSSAIVVVNALRLKRIEL